MKKLVFAFALLLIASLVSADNLYQYDTLDLELDIKGEFKFVPESDASQIKEASVDLHLVPTDNYRQEVKNLNSLGEQQEDVLRFEWQEPSFVTQGFGFDSRVLTQQERVKVRQKVPFPLEESQTEKFSEYLTPTETIDSDNQEIIRQATKLAQGEDDMFQVVFNIAHWVDSNVEYDLNTLTAETSQQASWVLKNRAGVCDEMTSLFIAMVRSLGIPARFVSGISYTTSDLFEEPWQPHGWAEVYFPNIGWVSFDITFGEYGYVDVTHIKLRDGFDPKEPATRFEWLAQDVELEAKELSFDVNIKNRGTIIPEEIELEQELLSPSVGFGSYNMVKGILKNTKNYYTATTLQMAAPKEIEILGNNKRTILLSPKEVRETFWVIKTPDDLKEGFWYEFPVLVFTEKNVSVQDVFTVRDGKYVYDKREIEELTVQDEEKTYSRKVRISCDYEERIEQGKRAQAECEIKNIGNTNLEDVTFCLDEDCKIIDLPINQVHKNKLELSTDSVGWNNFHASAQNGNIEKKEIFEYAVLDEPHIETKTNINPTIRLGEHPELTVLLTKQSFTVPKDITISLKGPGFETKWELDQLKNVKEFTATVKKMRVGMKNELVLTTTWHDEQGMPASNSQEILIQGTARDITERIKLIINSVINALS